MKRSKFLPWGGGWGGGGANLLQSPSKPDRNTRSFQTLTSGNESLPEEDNGESRQEKPKKRKKEEGKISGRLTWDLACKKGGAKNQQRIK